MIKMEPIDLKELLIDAFDHAEKKHRARIGEEAYKKELHERYPEAYRKGYEKGLKEAKEYDIIEIAKKLKGTLKAEEISKITGLSITTVESL